MTADEMATTCPKCGYTRQPTDTTPDYECPKCGVVYAKVQPAQQDEIPAAWKHSASGGAARRTIDGAGAATRKNLIACALTLPIIAWGGYEYFFGLAAQQRAEQRHRDAVRKAQAPAVQNSTWDGSVRQVERHLKKVLKDPDSFEAIEWGKIVQQGDRYLVRVKYRAKNSFGGYVVEQKVVELDGAGNVIGMAEAPI